MKFVNVTTGEISVQIHSYQYLTPISISRHRVYPIERSPDQEQTVFNLDLHNIYTDLGGGAESNLWIQHLIKEETTEIWIHLSPLQWGMRKGGG